MKSPSACRNMQIFHTLFTQPGKNLFSPARPVERQEVQTCRNSFAPPLNNAAILVIRPEIQSTKSSIRTFFAPRCKNVCSTLYEKDKYMNEIASPSCALCTSPCYWCILSLVLCTYGINQSDLPPKNLTNHRLRFLEDFEE